MFDADLKTTPEEVVIGLRLGIPVVNVDEPAFALCGYQVAAPASVNNMDTPAACSLSSRLVHDVYEQYGYAPRVFHNLQQHYKNALRKYSMALRYLDESLGINVDLKYVSVVYVFNLTKR
nr:hypothetical protein [Tanacetum cinerariifolium]